MSNINEVEQSSLEHTRWLGLTTRERQIACLIATGKSNKEIALDHCGISLKTYDTHRGHILKKMCLRSNVELAMLCIRRGFTTPQGRIMFKENYSEGVSGPQ